MIDSQGFGKGALPRRSGAGFTMKEVQGSVRLTVLAVSEGYCLRVVTASEVRCGSQGWLELPELRETKWGGSELKRISFPLNQD